MRFTNFYKLPDAEFSVWFANFIARFEEHKEELDLTDEQIAEIGVIKEDFQTALSEKQATDELSKAKNLNLKNKRKKSNEGVAFYNKTFKLNGVSDSLIQELGLITDSETVTISSPVTVTNLLVDGSSGGINSLKWNRNGNPVNSQFIVEARKEDETDFVYVGVTTKTKFDHKNQKPGVRVFYRIKAQKNDIESPYSNEAVVY